MKTLRDLKPGDKVLRHFSSRSSVVMTVKRVEGDLIHLGPWRFSISGRGVEEDEVLGWGIDSGISGSWIEPVQDEPDVG